MEPLISVVVEVVLELTPHLEPVATVVQVLLLLGTPLMQRLQSGLVLQGQLLQLEPTR
jgi:hypothetical protein